MDGREFMAGDRVMVLARNRVGTLMHDPAEFATRTWVTYDDGTREPVLVAELDLTER